MPEDTKSRPAKNSLELVAERIGKRNKAAGAALMRVAKRRGQKGSSK